jgi:hypothetical protein
MTSTMARWRPQRIAACGDEPPEGDDPGADAVELEAVRAITQDVAHGRPVSQHRLEIEKGGLPRRRARRRKGEGNGHHRQRSQAREVEGVAPTQVLGGQLRDQKGEADAQGEARRV